MQEVLNNPIFFNIPTYRINATDGKKDIMENFSINSPKISNVEYACLLSHLRTLQEFSKTEKKVALILEDDMTLEFLPNWSKTMKQIMDNAPTDWEIIQLCYISHTIPTYEYTLHKPNYYSTGAYLIKNEAAK